MAYGAVDHLLTLLVSRCGKPGHHIRNCPTNGNPAYDRGGSHNGGKGEGGAATVAKVYPSE